MGVFVGIASGVNVAFQFMKGKYQASQDKLKVDATLNKKMEELQVTAKQASDEREKTIRDNLLTEDPKDATFDNLLNDPKVSNKQSELKGGEDNNQYYKSGPGLSVSAKKYLYKKAFAAIDLMAFTSGWFVDKKLIDEEKAGATYFKDKFRNSANVLKNLRNSQREKLLNVVSLAGKGG